MSNLLMISGDRTLAEGKSGAFYNTLEEFRKYWDRIDIICPRVNNQSVGEIFGNVFIHPSPWPLIFQPLWIFKKGREIYKNQRFNLITVHEYPPFYNGMGARLLWNKIKVPYILEIHHIIGYPRSANFKELIYRTATRFFIKSDSSKAKAVRMVNNDQTRNFLFGCGISEKKLVYIPSSYIDLNVFKPLGSEKKYDLIFIGRLVENKGLNLLLKIAEKTDYRVLIVGAGPLYGYLKYQIKNHGLNIDMRGWVKDSSEVSRLINESKALIMLSDSEGGPRVVPEALACGVPVIATPVGIVPNVINHNNGRIINWSADEAIKAFEEIKDMEVMADPSNFERGGAIKNYADGLKELIR